MAGFSVKAQPTFTAKVGFPVPGDAPVDVMLTFKHRTRTQLDEFINAREIKEGQVGRDDVDWFMDMVAGWDLVEEFNRENAAELLQNYIGVASATFKAYIDQLIQHRLKN